MNIRLATTADIAGIRPVGQICWPETYRAIVPPGYIEDGLRQWWSVDFIQHAITTAENWLWVAEAAGEIVGMTHFALLEPYQAVMWKFYVLPAWCGKGVGRQLFDYALTLLPAEVHTIFTEYLSTNQRAAAVYLSLGFAFDHDAVAMFQGQPVTYTWVKRPRSIETAAA